MLRGDSTINALVLAAAAAIAIAYFIPRHVGSGSSNASVATQSAPAKPAWAAAAPGRVEPMGGEIRISPQTGGRIAEVPAQVGDKLVAGELIARLDDAELEARLMAAEAEISVRRRERDAETVQRPAQDRRNAEDAVANAERALSSARADLDRATRARRAGSGAAGDLDKAVQAMATARERIESARAALRRAQAAENLPAQTRLEAALVAARADWSIADAALERMRIRAPRDVTVLQMLATAGETAAPSPENVIAVVGDMSALRVRAEVEERDAGKVRVGQTAVVRSDSFPGKDFEGKVASFAKALGPGRIGQKGPRKPNDVDVLEVIIDLAGQTPLMPGMRVDVFLSPEQVRAAAARTN